MMGIGTFFLAFVTAYAGTFALLRVRLGRRFVDVPNDRSSHDLPKPRFGGIAIVGAFTIAVAFLALTGTPIGAFVPLVLGTLIVFVVGIVDDARPLHAGVRFGAQVAAASIVVFAGHVVDHVYLPLVGVIELGVVAIPFTLLFILASINFYNFIDGIDGLAAGNAVIASAFLSLIAYMLGHVPLALVCLAVAGGSLGFLQFNFPPSKLFMGDSGSTFLGFLFAFVAVAGNELAPPIPFFVPVLILSSLYLDAGLTLVRRLIAGERIFQPHHTHYYQRLLQLGFNHKQVTALEYGLTVLLGVSAVVFFKVGRFFPAFLTLCWITVFSVAILKIRSLERGSRSLWEKRTLFVIAGDLTLIALAYFGAYFLRMNFRFTDPEGTAVLRAFPIVLVVRSACFFWYGLYRGVWKYTSTPDVVRIIKAVATGSAIIVAILVLAYRFVSFPRSMFVIEFFLLIIAIGGVRFASRLFHEFGREALSGKPRRLAIIGAGDYGERVAREIRSTDGKNTSIVCYLDDDKAKSGLVLQGIPIDGPIDDLVAICARNQVDALVVGIAELPEERLGSIARLAREADVPLETREGAYSLRSQPAAVMFETLRRSLGRGLPAAVGTRTTTLYEGRRVLVTNANEEIGPALVRGLVALGGSVTAQVASASDVDVERLAGARVYVGAPEREFDAARMLDAAGPDIIFHCTPLTSPPVVNARDYLWRRIVRTTEALCKAVPRHGAQAIVFVQCHGDTLDDTTAGLSIVSEALAMNSPELQPAAPRILRLPKTLTEPRLRSLLKAHAGSAKTRFAMLEDEAVALCLEAGAGYSARAVLVPVYGSQFDAGEVVAALTHRASHVGPRASGPDAGPLYPNEEPKASLSVGLREIVGPLYPASDALLENVSRCLVWNDAGRLDHALQTVRAALYEGASQRASVE